MAERIIKQLIDDLDQTEIPDGKGGTVEFALRGTTYRIDLSAANITKLDKAFAPFIEAATRTGGARAGTTRASASTRKKRGGTRTPKRGSANPTAKIRAWATENGHEVSARGRIPAAVISAYDSAHKRSR
jgi:hypothetical protein